MGDEVFVITGGTRRGIETFWCLFWDRRIMAQAGFWQKNIKSHDIILIKHELNEISLVSQGYAQSDAHDITNKLYNYAEESREFYRLLNVKSGKKVPDLTINSGAIRKCDGRTH